jgi:cellobiose dehydrogenase (acceptor)
MLTHEQTDIEIAHPDVVFYDYYGAWNNPIAEDKEKYLCESAYPSYQKQ